MNCRLVSLEGLPVLPNLEKIDLSDNGLKGEELARLAKYPTLEAIAFGGNHVKTLQELKPLTSLSKLTQLDLFNNPISKDEESYRKQVFALLPSLKVLDLKDAKGQEVLGDEDEEDGDEESSYDDEDQFIDNDVAPPVKKLKTGTTEEQSAEDSGDEEEADGQSD